MMLLLFKKCTYIYFVKARESELKFFLTLKLVETKTDRQKPCEVKAIILFNENKILLTNQSAKC